MEGSALVGAETVRIGSALHAGAQLQLEVPMAFTRRQPMPSHMLSRFLKLILLFTAVENLPLLKPAKIFDKIWTMPGFEAPCSILG